MIAKCPEFGQQLLTLMEIELSGIHMRYRFLCRLSFRKKQKLFKITLFCELVIRARATTVCGNRPQQGGTFQHPGWMDFSESGTDGVSRLPLEAAPGDFKGSRGPVSI